MKAQRVSGCHFFIVFGVEKTIGRGILAAVIWTSQSMSLTRAEQAARQACAVGGQVAPSALRTSSNLPGLTADLSGTSADQ